MISPAFEGLSRILAERMINSLIAGTGVALLAWGFLRITGKRNSSTRFAVWFGALITLAVGPFFKADAVAGSSLSGISLAESWALYLFFGWVLFTSFALARIVIGFLQLMKLRSGCVAVRVEDLDPILRKTLNDASLSRKPVLCVSTRLQVPTALGFFQPLIAIPTWAMEEMSVAELNTILIHELAHVRRWDEWTNLLQKVVRAVFFFHPVAWWIDRQLSMEREMACDDEVLSRTENPKAYARCLVSVAEKTFLRRSFALAQAAVNHVRQTSMRVSQILDGKRSRATQVWKPALFATAGLAMASLVVSGQMPELVTFRDSRNPSFHASSRVSPETIMMSKAAPIPVSPAATNPKRVVAAYIPARARLKSRTIPAENVIQVRLSGLRPLQPEESFGGVAVSSSQPEPGAGSMLVVVHKQEYGPQGAMFWTVYVWRVNVENPKPARLDKAPPAKST